MPEHPTHRNGTLHAAMRHGTDHPTGHPTGHPTEHPRTPEPSPPTGDPSTGAPPINITVGAVERRIRHTGRLRRRLAWMASWCIASAGFLTWVLPDLGWANGIAILVCGLAGGVCIGARAVLGGDERALRLLLRWARGSGGRP